MRRYLLVNDGGVSRPVLIDHGHHESDEFWPEVQILYRWALLLSRNVLLPALQGRKNWDSESHNGVGMCRGSRVQYGEKKKIQYLHLALILSW